MAVESIGDNAYELTADGDELKEKICVSSFAAFTGDNAGQVIVTGNIIRIEADGEIIESAADESVLWKSGAMNANAMVAEPTDIGWVYGVRVSQPTGSRLVIYVK